MEHLLSADRPCSGKSSGEQTQSLPPYYLAGRADNEMGSNKKVSVSQHPGKR